MLTAARDVLRISKVRDCEGAIASTRRGPQTTATDMDQRRR
jgi:hypothetical protein